MKVRMNRFANTGTLAVSVGANRFMAWLDLSLVRWEWKVALYWTV